MKASDIELRFFAGTLEVRGLGREEEIPQLPGFQWDARIGGLRGPALEYASLISYFRESNLVYRDTIRGYGELSDGLQVRRKPRPFQLAALDSWRSSQGRGVVVLPTGAGKSYVALLCMDNILCDTLVVAPTLDLVAQWYDLIRTSFGCEVGIVGGGEYQLAKITVTTYDSAHMHMENWGNRFGLVVFDECHHLPGEAYSLSALSCIAPYRLGLTATPERADGRHGALDELIGPVVYRCEVGDLAGDYLANYTVEQIYVDLSSEEKKRYADARQEYLQFIRSQKIQMGRPDGWSQFIIRSSQSSKGRSAMKAYQTQKQIAFAAPSKLHYLDHLLFKHRHDRVLVFTERNQSAYEISERFLIPVITHQTKVSERSAILEGFAQGVYNAIATSKVLNEGVDMPEANVAIVLSGSGSVREHVQRLGRILRKQGDKQAKLYELVANDTIERSTSTRRREHVAYN